MAKCPPSCLAVAQIGGKATGLSGRIKDFEVLKPADMELSKESLIIIAASSDGATRVWIVEWDELSPASTSQTSSNNAMEDTNGNVEASESASVTPKQIGRLIGTYQTGGNRITCMKAFVMASQTPDDKYGSDSALANGNGENEPSAVESGSESDTDR